MSSEHVMLAMNNAECDAELLRELHAEKEALESDNRRCRHRHALRLIHQEIHRLQSGRGDSNNNNGNMRLVDVYRERPVRLTVRVLVPVREHPKFNFVGKLLGPKGNSMKRLQEETMTKMAVLGRGSMRDKQKEEELRASSDPKYGHLHEDLHVEITAFAPPAEAHARLAFALSEVRKYLIPDSNDEIRQTQMREMELMANTTSTTDLASIANLLGANGASVFKTMAPQFVAPIVFDPAAVVHDPKNALVSTTTAASALEGESLLWTAGLKALERSKLRQQQASPYARQS